MSASPPARPVAQDADRAAGRKQRGKQPAAEARAGGCCAGRRCRASCRRGRCRLQREGRRERPDDVFRERGVDDVEDGRVEEDVEEDEQPDQGDRRAPLPLTPSAVMGRRGPVKPLRFTLMVRRHDQDDEAARSQEQDDAHRRAERPGAGLAELLRRGSCRTTSRSGRPGIAG